MVLPPAPYAYDFVMANSNPEDEPEMVTGLYCYAELVIQQVSWLQGLGGVLTLCADHSRHRDVWDWR